MSRALVGIDAVITFAPALSPGQAEVFRAAWDARPHAEAKRQLVYAWGGKIEELARPVHPRASFLGRARSRVR